MRLWRWRLTVGSTEPPRTGPTRAGAGQPRPAPTRTAIRIIQEAPMAVLSIGDQFPAYELTAVVPGNLKEVEASKPI